MADDDSTAQPDSFHELRQRLSGIDRVEEVVLDAATGRVLLVLRTGSDAERVRDAAEQALGDASLTITPVFRQGPRDRERVRFSGLARTETPDLRSAFTVRLEWDEHEYAGTAKGEKGAALELRTVALAALHAVSQIAPDDMQIRLAGIKQVRAFDSEMVVVSLYRHNDQRQNLVGMVMAGGDPNRAAALAVLSALNRLLGNYLVT